MNFTNQPNTQCLMFYYYVHGIDIDEAQHLYWAGLLGKSSKSLPNYRVEGDSNGNKEITEFTWTDHSFTYKYDQGSSYTIDFSYYE